MSQKPDWVGNLITYLDGDREFKYRVAGVAVDEGHVLIHQVEGAHFWSLPGGRGEWFEAIRDTLQREMREELGVEAEVGRFIWVTESFFTHRDRRCHELAFYFQFSFPRNPEVYDKSRVFHGVEGDLRLEFRWHRIDRLDEVVLLPPFLREGLKAIPGQPTHLVQRDDDFPHS